MIPAASREQKRWMRAAGRGWMGKQETECYIFRLRCIAADFSHFRNTLTGYKSLFWFWGANTISPISTIMHSSPHIHTHTHMRRHTHARKPYMRPQTRLPSFLNISWLGPMLTNSRPCKQFSLTSQRVHNLLPSCQYPPS